jgi:hypothetical protein
LRARAHERDLERQPLRLRQLRQNPIGNGFEQIRERSECELRLSLGRPA